MNQFLSYFAFFLTIIGGIFTILQSLYLFWLRLGLFPFTPQSLDPETLAFKHMDVAFIRDMLTLLFMLSVIEIALLCLLVAINFISPRQGIVAILVLIILVGFVSLFAFSAFIFEK